MALLAILEQPNDDCACTQTMPVYSGCSNSAHQSSPGAMAQPARQITVPRRAYPGPHESSRLPTRKRFSDGQGPAPSTGYSDPDSALELSTVSPAAPSLPSSALIRIPTAPCFLHAAAVSAGGAALLMFGLLAAAAQAQPSETVVGPWRRSFVLWNGLLYCRGGRGDRLCILDACALRRLVLTSGAPHHSTWQALWS